jgi:lipopolysaccharide export system permease protein
MKLVDRQVLRELTGPFIFGVAAFSSVFFAGSVLLKLTEWLMNGMPLLMALEIVIYSLPSIVFWTLPMSTLLAVLIGVGRLSGESEVVALFAGGISFYRLSVPILLFGLVVSGISLLLNEVVAPVASSRSLAIQAALLKQVAISDTPFTFEDPDTSSRIIVQGGMDKDKGILRNVSVIQFYKNRPALLVYADRAEWAGIKDPSNRYRWKLYDGFTQLMDPREPRSMATTTFENTQTREIEMKKTPDDLSAYQNLKAEQMSFTQLNAVVRSLKQYPDRQLDQIRRLDVEMWNKIAVPLTSLVFALLAAPLGIRPHRSSSSVGMGMSILVIFLYWILGRYTWSLAIQGTVWPVVGAFAPLMVGVAAASILLVRAAK